MRNLPDDIAVPVRWLVAVVVFSFGCLGSAVFLGEWVKGIDGRLEAQEIRRQQIEMSVQRVMDLEERLDVSLRSIDNRLSVIEGRIKQKHNQ